MAEAWDTARIREAFIYDGGEAEYHDPISGAQTQRKIAGEIFDRYLAAHDAQVRAEERERAAMIADRYATAPGRNKASIESIAARDVAARIRASAVPEEPEWEYTWSGTDDDGDEWIMDDAFATVQSAENYAHDRSRGFWVLRDGGKLMRRRKAGPWEPIEQGGEHGDL